MQKTNDGILFDSFHEWWEYKRKHNLRVVHSKWDGRGLFKSPVVLFVEDVQIVEGKAKLTRGSENKD